MQRTPNAFAVALVATALTAPRTLAQEGAAAPAQGEGAPIVVTARKVEERIEDVPSSVSVVTGSTIEKSSIRSVREATARVPNLVMTEFSSRRLSFPYVRGIGSGIGEPAVVTYIDGVPQLTVGSTNLPPIDLERIEVLRGPQGTLYGRNALGGVLNVVSARPGDTLRASLSTTFGNNGQRDYRADFSGPVGSNGVGASLSLLHSERDGFTTNRATGNDVDSRESLFGRAQVVFRPTEDSELRVSLYAERADDGGFVLAPLDGLRRNPFTIDQDFEGTVERDVTAPAITFTQFGDSFDFTSITAYTDWDVTETSDFDFTRIDGVRRRTTEDQSFFYQELRLNSNNKTGVRWLAGVSGFASDSGRAASNDFRPDGAGVFFPPLAVGVDTNDGSFDDVGLSAFGQVTVPVSDTVEVTGGVRYDREDKEADLRRTFVTGGFTAVDQSRSLEEDFDQVSPTLSVLWRAADDTNVYALASRAFKAGGFNLAAPSDQFFFEPETSWTYEVGVKHAVTDALDVRVALFLIEWDDMQLSLFDPSAGGYVANAGESTSQGIEVEVIGRIGDAWSAYASAGFLDTEFDNFIDSFGNDTAGNSLPFAPDNTVALGVQHSRIVGDGLKLDVALEAQHVGDFYYDPSNLAQENYTLVNASVGLSGKRWRAALFGRNLGDQEYVPIAFQANPADPTFFVGENAAPRLYGVTLGWSF